MAEVSSERLVEMLRRIQSDLSDVKGDVREIGTRPGLVDMQLASLSNRLDRRDDQMDRILRRLDLTEASHREPPPPCPSTY